MKSHLNLVALTVLALIPATKACALISIDTVAVGNANNSPDPTTGFGTVGYEYSIGKHEVTLDQYTTFLNAVASTDTYSLYNPSMGTDLINAGITRSGTLGSYSYSIIGNVNRSVK